jgi:predicted  nucleic acid-binding Zn-ribbon protein
MNDTKEQLKQAEAKLQGMVNRLNAIEKEKQELVNAIVRLDERVQVYRELLGEDKKNKKN